MSLEDLDEVEGKCVEAFTQLVVHLSESVFRPMFLKVTLSPTTSIFLHSFAIYIESRSKILSN